MCVTTTKIRLSTGMRTPCAVRPAGLIPVEAGQFVFLHAQNTLFQHKSRDAKSGLSLRLNIFY